MLYAAFGLFALFLLLLDVYHYWPMKENTPPQDEDWWDHPS